MSKGWKLSNEQIGEKLSAGMVRARYAQLVINEYLKLKRFHIPVHLALGHEAISEAVGATMAVADKLVCSHRNIHYQFARGATLLEIIEEFKLSPAGLGRGRGGSMNLTNPSASILYTSSILGNNLCVAAGVALSMRIKREKGVVFVVTGDGAIEEGALYETLGNARNMDLPLIVLVENNHWSLASNIEERRKPIDLRQFSASLGAGYISLNGNSSAHYVSELVALRDTVEQHGIPAIVEIGLTTLGHWTLATEEFPDGKFVNYHAGSSPRVSFSGGPILAADSSDPVFVVQEALGHLEFDRLSQQYKMESMGLLPA